MKKNLFSIVFALVLLLAPFFASAETEQLNYPPVSIQSCLVTAYKLKYERALYSLYPSWTRIGMIDGSMGLDEVESDVFSRPDVNNFYGLKDIVIRLVDETIEIEANIQGTDHYREQSFEIVYGNLLNFTGFKTKARLTHYSSQASIQIKPKNPKEGDNGMEYYFSCVSPSWYTGPDGQVL